MMHTLHCYFKPGAGVLKWQDKQLPDPNGPLYISFIISAEVIQNANDAHTTESTSPGVVNVCKQSQDSYIKLMPVQQVQVTKNVLASGN